MATLYRSRAGSGLLQFCNTSASLRGRLLNMIKTKSIYHDSTGPEDGYRLLVMRRWPRGIRRTQVDGWLKELGPSSELLGKLRDGKIDWQTFSRLYKEQVGGTEAGRALLEEVEGLEKAHGAVTLLCHEDLTKPNTNCHRVLLKELLDLPRRQAGTKAHHTTT